MKNLIKKILKESNGDGDEITIAGVTFTIDDYISKDYNNKNSIFLNLSYEERISYEKFLEIQSILKNVGIESEPSTYHTRGSEREITYVRVIRIISLDLKPILKMYLETKLNTNSGTFFE